MSPTMESTQSNVTVKRRDRKKYSHNPYNHPGTCTTAPSATLCLSDLFVSASLSSTLVFEPLYGVLPVTSDQTIVHDDFSVNKTTYNDARTPATGSILSFNKGRVQHPCSESSRCRLGAVRYCPACGAALGRPQH